MANTVRITYFGMEGEGRTLTDAKRDAGAKIERALSGPEGWNPQIVSWRGFAVLVYRTPEGWHSALIIDAGETRVSICYGSNEGDKAAALRGARLHVAQCGWTHADGETLWEGLTDREEKREHLSWVRFQIRYRAARARGLSDNDAHSYAGRNPGRADLWAHEPATV